MTDTTISEHSGTEPTDHAAHAGEHEHHSPTDAQFIIIFFILAGITAIEVLVSYIDIGAAFLPVLLGLMVIKFFTVVLYFMHIKFDNKAFGRLFYVGLGLAMFSYLVVFSTFRFFGG